MPVNIYRPNEDQGMSDEEDNLEHANTQVKTSDCHAVPFSNQERNTRQISLPSCTPQAIATLCPALRCEEHAKPGKKRFVFE